MGETMTAPEQTEKQFQAAVVEYAKRLGYACYHTFDSRRSEPGFPDLVLVRDQRVIFAELKRESGRVTKAQQFWIDTLTVAGQAVFVWRPSSWPAIEEVLR